MSNNLEEINQSEFDKIYNARLTAIFQGQEQTITDRIILADIITNNQITRTRLSYFTPLHFSNCIFKGKIVIGYPQSAGNHYFENCIFENKVSFLSIDNIKLIGKNIFKDNLTIQNGSSQEFHISNLDVEKCLEIRSTKQVNLILENINLKTSIIDQTIKLVAQVNELEVDNIKCVELEVIHVAPHNLNTFTSLECDKIFIRGPWDNRKIEIEKSKFKNVILENISNDNNQLKFLKCNIEIFSIPFSEIGSLDISDSEIDYLVLKQTNTKDAIANFQNVRVHNQLRFEKFYNKGTLFLREIKILNNCHVGIFSSDLGKTDFINCDFSKGIFEFENSKLTDVFLSKSNFPKIVKLKQKVDASQGQLAFGQLATAYTRQGDTIRALEYQSREIEAHYHSIDWKSKDFFKKFNLCLNKWSNNFGRWWQLGLLFSFTIGIIFFFLLLLSSKDYRYSTDFNGDLASAFLKFMNPLRFLDTEALFRFRNQNTILRLNPWSYFWDFWGRLFVAYGYYQTIQAFRRFGRK